MMTRDSIRRGFGPGLLGAAALSLAACGDVARTGRSPVLLVVETVEAASGNAPDQFFAFLLSDVQTLVEQQVNGQTVRVPTIFNDSGRIRLRLTLKDPGTAASPTAPTTLNEVTITRYRVVFRRADGRNTPGVDLPHAFDGAATGTIPANGNVSLGFDLVRHQAKHEPPLASLAGGGGSVFISTIAEITVYGSDLAGNEISATGTISVQFGDFADPD
jgi:hypothetical protein